MTKTLKDILQPYIPNTDIGKKEAEFLSKMNSDEYDDRQPGSDEYDPTAKVDGTKARKSIKSKCSKDQEAEYDLGIPKVNYTRIETAISPFNFDEAEDAYDPVSKTRKEVSHYHIVNGHQGDKIVGKAKTLKSARRVVDRHDNNYGAYAHRIRPVFKEDEQLEELSKGTLGSYVKKSDKNFYKASSDRAKAAKAGKSREEDKNWKTMIKRNHGSGLAKMKMSGQANVNTKEEIENTIEELSKATLRSYVDKAGAELKNKEQKPSTTKTFKKSLNRTNGVYVASTKIMQKENDQIDELSSSTLKSYVDKSYKQYKTKELGNMLKKKNTDERLISNRREGVKKAFSRLNKEDEQLDELSKKILIKYVMRANKKNAATIDRTKYNERNKYISLANKKRSGTDLVKVAAKEHEELSEKDRYELELTRKNLKRNIPHRDSLKFILSKNRKSLNTFTKNVNEETLDETKNNIQRQIGVEKHLSKRKNKGENLNFAQKLKMEKDKKMNEAAAWKYYEYETKTEASKARRLHHEYRDKNGLGSGDPAVLMNNRVAFKGKFMGPKPAIKPKVKK